MKMEKQCAEIPLASRWKWDLWNRGRRHERATIIVMANKSKNGMLNYDC